jgi:hypothetical protein
MALQLLMVDQVAQLVHREPAQTVEQVVLELQ